MPIQAITQQKYMNFRDRFYKEVTKSPTVVTITFFTAASEGSFTDFTGDSTRLSKTCTLKALYDRNLTEYKRTQYGLAQDVSGLLFISPIHFQQACPDFQNWLDNFQRMQVKLYDEEYQVSFVRYKEPLYGTCIAIQLNLKKLHRGVS